MSKHFIILALTWLVMAIVFFLEKHVLVGIVESCVCLFDIIVAIVSLKKEKSAENAENIENDEYEYIETVDE